MMLEDFANVGDKRIALVTGAAGGIGQAIVDVLRRKGWRTAGADLKPSTADMHYPVDLSDHGQASALVGLVASDMGLPTALVNAAGIYRAVHLPETDERYIEEVMAVNLVAPLVLCREFIGRHVAGGTRASVVNVASVSGEMGSPDPSYAASKGGLIAMTRGLGRAYAAQGVRVNAVAPGVIDTEMAALIPADRRKQYRRSIPSGRFGTAEEVAAAVAFLLDDESSYMAGTVLDVNGGLF
ncbi:3-oxoacyl-[acyl-carrier-protein] reductase [Microbispora corallina]|uniref:3-oxoacyl-[acyl-carrier-protein] reductase n=1 Tax=Microbispora corallina TaxID=83302 RepID=A0ABQ4GBF3_9ACTN|nr:SDR family oxidoreductase [Microbispora corallina]GIH44372.1 3-oxoacyl-[acyl-carrier-protein] reductase [Microbispora corallina]